MLQIFRNLLLTAITAISLNLFASPAHARRTVIDDRVVDLYGCDRSDLSCAPTLLPFDILIGGELTRNIFLFGDSGQATIYLGSLDSGQRFTISNNNSERGNYDREAVYYAFENTDDSFEFRLEFGASICCVGAENGGSVLIRSLSDGGSPGDFEFINYSTSRGVGSASFSEATSDDFGFGFHSYAFQSAVPAQSAVPEPSTWATMLLGFGAIGFSVRRRRPRRDLASIKLSRVVPHYRLRKV